MYRYPDGDDAIGPGVEAIISEGRSTRDAGLGRRSTRESHYYAPPDAYSTQNNLNIAINKMSEKLHKICAAIDSELDELRCAIGELAKKADEMDEAIMGLPCASLMYNEALTDFEALKHGDDSEVP